LNFDTSPESIDFQEKQAAAQTINNWAAVATKGKISDLIQVELGLGKYIIYFLHNFPANF
jgi:serine protease inhibitor